MDGGSTDETASVVKDYASRLTFVTERDRGQSHAINKGFRQGSGSIRAWINSDDVYLPGAISAAVRAFGANPHSGMVYGEGYVMDRDGIVQGRFRIRGRSTYGVWCIFRTIFFNSLHISAARFSTKSVISTKIWPRAFE